MLALERGAASMGAAVAIGRLDMTASALRAAASREKDGAAARRILALALVLDGADRKTAAETCGMDRQTLRDWVHRYNAEGLTGPHDLTPPGPKPKLTAEQQAELAGLVEMGPDPARHGVVRWRRVDLRDELQRRFGVALHERSVGKVLAKLDYCRLSVRPRHPQTDEEAQEAFKKTSPRRSSRGSPTMPKISPFEIWFQDEARIGQQGTLTRVWARRGTRPRAPRYGSPRRPSRQHRSHVIASGRDRSSGRSRQPRRSGPRRCGLSRRQGSRRPPQHHPRPPAALRARTQPNRKRLGISARQQARDYRIRQLRRHPRQGMRRLDILRQRPKPHRVHHNPLMGNGHSLRPLVLLLMP